MKFLVLLGAIALCVAGQATAWTVRQEPPTQAPTCPRLNADFGFLETNKDACNYQLIFDSLFVHNETGNYALVPGIYKMEKFQMELPVKLNIAPQCSDALDTEVYCMFVNRADFAPTGILQMTDAITLVKASCKPVPAACRSVWDQKRRMVTNV